MTKFVFRFPVAQRRALKCVWTLTGDPVRPLACHWEESGLAVPARPFLIAVCPQNQRICA